ncbi:MAG TPA: redoxin family protein [Candidatus Blautia stercoravium]|nr:redoxin family protein [Candidatus Blautia stercoravium]
MGFSLDVSVPVFTVFLQGLISFFSPCILPLIPLYIGYLSGGTGTMGEDGKMHYKKSKVMLHTCCFVIGVSFAFFLLGLGFSAMGEFFKSNQALFARIGGILVVFLGLYQLGVFGSSKILGNERRLPLKLNVLAMSPITALLMGFTFSFAWTPCVGPALTSVLLMAASASTHGMGFLLIGVYTVGFILPFLAVGLFTTTVLEFFKSHGKAVRYTVKAGGVLMVLMGVLMFTGKMNSVTGYLSGVPADTVQEKEDSKTEEDAVEEKGGEKDTADEKTETEEENTSAGTEEAVTPAVDFTLKDQYGNTHTLSEYKGKTVFLNFWATWCPPCKAEMPDIQKIYEEYQEKGDDSLVILGIAAPNWGQEQSQEGITAFLEEKGYTYPVVMDTTGEMFMAYGISSFPTTFMIDKEGNVFGYASGQLSEDMMRSIIRQTVEGKRE